MSRNPQQSPPPLFSRINPITLKISPTTKIQIFASPSPSNCEKEEEIINKNRIRKEAVLRSIFEKLNPSLRGKLLVREREKKINGQNRGYWITPKNLAQSDNTIPTEKSQYCDVEKEVLEKSTPIRNSTPMMSRVRILKRGSEESSLPIPTEPSRSKPKVKATKVKPQLMHLIIDTPFPNKNHNDLFMQAPKSLPTVCPPLNLSGISPRASQEYCMPSRPQGVLAQLPSLQRSPKAKMPFQRLASPLQLTKNRGLKGLQEDPSILRQPRPSPARSPPLQLGVTRGSYSSWRWGIPDPSLSVDD